MLFARNVSNYYGILNSFLLVSNVENITQSMLLLSSPQGGMLYTPNMLHFPSGKEILSFFKYISKTKTTVVFEKCPLINLTLHDDLWYNYYWIEKGILVSFPSKLIWKMDFMNCGLYFVIRRYKSSFILLHDKKIITMIKRV